MDSEWAFNFLVDKAESWLSRVNENADTSMMVALQNDNAIAIREMVKLFSNWFERPISAEDVLDTAAQNLFGRKYNELRMGW